MSHYIISELRGGLGNQLFQYSIGRSLSLLRQLPLILDISFLSGTNRKFELGNLPICADVISYKYHRMLSEKCPFASQWIYRNLIEENGFHYNSGWDSKIGPVRLRGYWQSPKYFFNYFELIRKEVTPEPHILDKYFIDLINSSNSIAVHIRRGDYLTNPLALQFHGIIGNDYYRAAIAYMIARIKKPTFFIFTDATQSELSEISLPDDSIIVKSKNPDPISDLALIALCRHHIIANSTFSWWGAFLSNHKTGMNIYPKKWFRDPSIITSDLFPDEWFGL